MKHGKRAKYRNAKLIRSIFLTKRRDSGIVRAIREKAKSPEFAERSNSVNPEVN